jgi:hypothetical protein
MAGKHHAGRRTSGIEPVGHGDGRVPGQAHDRIQAGRRIERERRDQDSVDGRHHLCHVRHDRQASAVCLKIVDCRHQPTGAEILARTRPHAAMKPVARQALERGGTLDILDEVRETGSAAESGRHPTKMAPAREPRGHARRGRRSRQAPPRNPRRAGTAGRSYRAWCRPTSHHAGSHARTRAAGRRRHSARPEKESIRRCRCRSQTRPDRPRLPRQSRPTNRSPPRSDSTGCWCDRLTTGMRLRCCRRARASGGCILPHSQRANVTKCRCFRTIRS